MQPLTLIDHRAPYDFSSRTPSATHSELVFERLLYSFLNILFENEDARRSGTEGFENFLVENLEERWGFPKVRLKFRPN